MKDYYKARQEVKGLMVATLEQDLLNKSGQKRSSKTLREAVEARTEELLGRFEEIAFTKIVQTEFRNSRPGFWIGVGQSLLGSVLLFVLLAVFALVLYGMKVNPFELLTR
jgi:hypothetical protein